jgi:D-alanine-D-alanine ligase
VTERTAAAAITAHKVLGCAGVSRSDFIIDSDGEPWILETNTIPGMTSTSLLPDAARVAGIDFPELCTKLIELAFERKE